LDLNYAGHRSVIPDTGWYGDAVDTVRSEAGGHRAGSDVRQDQRAPFLTALEQARAAAFPVGEYVGQESFMRAGEIRRLAHRARVGPGVSVLDRCWGVAGRGRMITADSGCRYRGVDSSAPAVAIARELAWKPPCRFEQAHLPPLPDGPFEVVL